jgi:hypothetical protein
LWQPLSLSRYIVAYKPFIWNLSMKSLHRVSGLAVAVWLVHQSTSGAGAQVLENRLNLARLHALSQLSTPRSLSAQRLVTQTSAQAASQTVENSTLADRGGASPVVPQPIVDEDDYQPRIVERRRSGAGASTPAPASSPDRPQASPPATLPQNTPDGPPGESTDDIAGVPGTTPGNVVQVRGRRPIGISVDTRLGFDNADVIVNVPSPNAPPLPVAVDVKRRIASVSVSASYPLGRVTELSLGIPFVAQRVESSAFGQTIKRKGTGLGDVSLFLTQRFPEVARGTEFAVSGGLIFPTGKHPFNLGPGELPTGNGFYQALLRFSISKMRVPFQFFASVDYGKTFARTFNGQRFTQPNDYGGQIGFFYTMGPELTLQSSLSYSKQSSPFLLQPGSTTAYLSQALSYNTGTAASLRGGVDLGLTDASTDAYVNFSYNNRF